MEKEREVSEETEYLFDKTMECPVCGKSFRTKQVKASKAKFLGTEMDLRPIYRGIDTVKYDAVVCINCGYAAIMRDFDAVSDNQIKKIKENISKNFKSPGECEGAYSYNLAIQRYKLALYVSMLKIDKKSDIAYLCLKIAWLYRGFQKNIPESDPDYTRKISSLKEAENQYIEKAYKVFLKALGSEQPPFCGIPDTTFNYMMADLARQCREYENAEHFIFDVLSDKSSGAKLKEKAREELEAIRKDKGKTGEEQ